MLLLAPTPQLTPRTCARRTVGAPQFEQRGKFRFAVVKNRAVRRFLAEPNIGHAQSRDDRQQLALGVEALALEQGTAQARIERQPRHGPAAARDTAIVIERLQFLQEAIAIVEGAR